MACIKIMLNHYTHLNPYTRWLLTGDGIKALIEFFEQLKLKSLITNKDILMLFSSRPSILMNFLLDVADIFSINAFLKYVATLIKDSDDRNIIKPLFSYRQSPFGYYGDGVTYPFFECVQRLMDGVPQGCYKPFANVRAIDCSVLLDLIANNCLDYATLSTLAFLKNQIVSAALAKTTSEEEKFDLALVSQGAATPLGLYLLWANGFGRATATYVALSSLGALLATPAYLPKVLEAIRHVGRFSPDQLKGLAFLKNDLCKHIRATNDAQLRVQLCVETLNKETPLGELFHLRRGVINARVSSGSLESISAQLRTDIETVVLGLKDKRFGSSAALQALGKFRAEIIDYLVKNTPDFWQDYKSATQTTSYLGLYLMANNALVAVTPSSPLMRELNAALYARPALLLEKIRSEFPEAWYPALKEAPAVLIKHLRAMTNLKVLGTLLIESLTEGTPLNKFFVGHSSKILLGHNYVAELRALKAENDKKLEQVAATVAAAHSMSSLNGVPIVAPTDADQIESRRLMGSMP